MKKLMVWLMASLLLLASCAQPPASPAVSPSSTQEMEVSLSPEPSVPEPFKDISSIPEQIPPVNYVRELADQLIGELIASDMNPEESIQKVYLYLIDNVYFAEPVGLDVWQWRSSQTEPPTYVENRAISPLAFGIGSCEDFAAALVVLLEQMGFEAQYVAGYTLSVEGEYVDHAWAVVHLGENWYHLDPQLEQNIVRNGTTAFRFFLKSDEHMLADHKWGENLIAFWPGITPEDTQRIRSEFTPPACIVSYPTLAPIQVVLSSQPDRSTVKASIQKERQQAGPLESIPLNIEPPVLITPN
ncbi:transglutaminase-like domain-containing protein [Oscillospiraceae bacterium MB08-C2-2]|nr:transglutaminase-like domain-containing protein [Oscillospiraceae bacterium MB08-C2-2]